MKKINLLELKTTLKNKLHIVIVSLQKIKSNKLTTIQMKSKTKISSQLGIEINSFLRGRH